MGVPLESIATLQASTGTSRQRLWQRTGYHKVQVSAEAATG